MTDEHTAFDGRQDCSRHSVGDPDIAKGYYDVGAFVVLVADEPRLAFRRSRSLVRIPRGSRLCLFCQGARSGVEAPNLIPEPNHCRLAWDFG